MIPLMLLMSLNGCQKEEEDGIPTVIHITPAKTYYQAGRVLWDEGDQIAVIRGIGSDFHPFEVSRESVGSDNGTFTGTVSSDQGNYHVVYPYREGETYSVDNAGLHITAIRPRQTLCHGTFGRGDNVSVGVSENTDVFLQNLGGLLKIQVQGAGLLKAIRITDNDGQKLAGAAVVPLYGDDRLSVHFESNATNSILAEAPGSPFNLLAGETFFVVRPPITLHNYTITLIDNHNWVDEHEYTDANLTIGRSEVKSISLTAHDFVDKTCLRYRTNDGSSLETQINAIASANGTTVTITGSASEGWKASFATPITVLPNNVFENCSTLTSITLPNTLTTIGKVAFLYSGITSITIPYGVTSIGDGAFKRCESMTDIVLPTSLDTLSDYMLEGCISLRHVTVPNGVTTINNSVFESSSGLESVTFPNSVRTMGDAVFKYCSNLLSVSIPEGVTSIGWEFFLNCGQLVSVTLPTTLRSMGANAFRECSSLSSITIPALITSLPSDLFYGCRRLAHVELPQGLTSIEPLAFIGCSSLPEITLPSQVNSIGTAAFDGCDGLQTVVCENPVPPYLDLSVERNVVFGCYWTTFSANLYVPSGSVEAYKQSSWNTYFSDDRIHGLGKRSK